MKETFLQYLGVERYRVGHTEKLVSALGAFLGIFLIFYTSTYFVHGVSSYLVVASMGASAVLLFAVPHGPLSQPWSLIGGHLVSAAIGVTCAKFIPDIFIAAPLAVGLSVAVMYYLHCIHPPGGATALSAVVGGSAVQELGYQFILTPVLINVFAILGVAIGEFVPDDDHGDAAREPDEDEPHHVLRHVGQKGDGEHEHENRADDPVLDQRERQDLPIAKNPAHLFIAHLGQGRVHHQDEPDGDWDVGGAHREAIPEIGDAGPQPARADAHGHGEEDPQGQVAVDERQFLGDSGHGRTS